MKVLIILLSINTILLLASIWIQYKVFEIMMEQMVDSFSKILEAMELTAEYTAIKAANLTYRKMLSDMAKKEGKINE